jgi:catechol 2,3-dioxygenase-like lactoylglutathione lyase family enzyme
MLQKSPLYAYIPARDIARARKFYEKTLGLKAKEEYAGGVIYEFGAGTACFLYPTPNAGTSRASQAFWQVDDVEREVAELKARGVVFEEYDMPGVKMQNSIAAGGGAKTAWFKDRGKYSGGEPTPVSNKINGNYIKNSLATTTVKPVTAISARAAKLSLGATIVFLVLLALLHVIEPEFGPMWRFMSEYSTNA